jgi:hypothetical protein
MYLPFNFLFVILLLKNNQAFPYVLLNGFEAYAYDARKKGRFSEIMYTPLVYNESKWLEFSAKSSGWYNQSKQIYDALEPGKNRSIEEKSFHDYKVLHEVNELGIVVTANDTDNISSQGRMICPTLYTSPPPSMNAITFQNVDLSSMNSFKSLILASLSLNGKLFPKCT